MINEYCAKKFCCEDLSLIENYELAVNDNTQMWEIHHRGEVLPCGRFSRDDLKKFGLYYKRPAAELILLTKAEHNRLHKRGIPRSEATKKAMSESSSKKILQFTKSGEFIREWSSAYEAYRQLGIANSSICKCCNGKYKSAGGFVWRYATNVNKNM